MYKKIVMLLLLSGQIGCSTNAVDHGRASNIVTGLALASCLTVFQKILISDIPQLNNEENKFLSRVACAGSLLVSVPLLFPQASTQTQISCCLAGNVLTLSNLAAAIYLCEKRKKRFKRSTISMVPAPMGSALKSLRKAELDADVCFVCFSKLSELQSEGKHVVFQSECCGNFACEEDLVKYVDCWNKAEHLNNEYPSCPMCKVCPWGLQPFDLEKNEALKTGQRVMLLEKK
jgi:hypothetical protein